MFKYKRQLRKNALKQMWLFVNSVNKMLTQWPLVSPYGIIEFVPDYTKPVPVSMLNYL